MVVGGISTGLIAASFTPAHALQEGTRTWSAPEVLKSFRDSGQGSAHKGRISVQADVYSFGVVAWEIVTQADPVQGWHDIRWAQKARLRPEHADAQALIAESRLGLRWCLWVPCSRSCHVLIIV